MNRRVAVWCFTPVHAVYIVPGNSYLVCATRYCFYQVINSWINVGIFETTYRKKPFLSYIYCFFIAQSVFVLHNSQHTVYKIYPTHWSDLSRKTCTTPSIYVVSLWHTTYTRGKFDGDILKCSIKCRKLRPCWTNETRLLFGYCRDKRRWLVVASGRIARLAQSRASNIDADRLKKKLHRGRPRPRRRRGRPKSCSCDAESPL